MIRGTLIHNQRKRVCPAADCRLSFLDKRRAGVASASEAVVAHNLLIRQQQMDSHAPLHNPPPTPVPPRVWQDVAAESLLCMAVVVIAMTGNNSVVLEINRWLAALIPAYDPMVTMLVVMIVVIAALILGSIGLKMSARRASEAPILQPARPRGTRSRRTLPYLGS